MRLQKTTKRQKFDITRSKRLSTQQSQKKKITNARVFKAAPPTLNNNNNNSKQTNKQTNKQ